MKAIVFSADSLSYDVLERALKSYSVQSCERRTTRDTKVADDDETIIFLDFDDAGFATMRPLLPSQTIIVAFGSYEAQKASKGELNFLTKPFSKANLDQMLRKIILKQVAFDSTKAAGGEVVAIDAVKKEITQWLDHLKKHRREFGEMLLVPPSQLKELLMQKAAPPSDSEATGTVPSQAFPFRRALIVEGEDINVRQLSRYLINKCVLQTDIAADGHEAWQKLKQFDYEIVILSWEIEKVSGLALYNRLRSLKKYRYRPVLIMSNVLSSNDFRLCDEDFAAGLLEKPIAEKTFSIAFEQVAGNAIVSQKDQDGLFNAVCQAVEAGVTDFSKALGTPDIDPVLLNALRLAGEYFVTLNRYSQAVIAFGAAWNLGDRRLSLLTGYGKATYLSGDTLKGRQILAQADFLTPGNIERLCLLGEIDLCLKNPERAREKFLAALAIDKHYIQAQAGLNVSETLMEEKSPGEAPIDSTHFASYLNMVGITLAHKGQSDKAVKYYNSAMVFIRNSEDIVKLWFNVGLCYLRAKSTAKAESAFKKAYTLSGGKFKLAAKYLTNKSTKQLANKIRFEEI